MSTNPIMTTTILSTIANVCVDSSDRSSTTTTILAVLVSINIKFISKLLWVVPVLGLMLLTVLLLPSCCLLLLGLILLFLLVL